MRWRGSPSRRQPTGSCDDGVRAVPFYCPFCGEQDIRPDDAAAAAWRCESCERGFELTAITVGGGG